MEPEQGRASTGAKEIKSLISNSVQQVEAGGVMLEVEWVLRSSFEFGKDDVRSTLSNLLSAAELTFESERA